MAAVSPTKAPNVGRCLSGDEVLVSWDDILNALRLSDSPPSALHHQFLADNKHFLSQTIPSLGKSNAAAKSTFENAVAPINLPSEALQKEAEQIKSDTTWLSSVHGLNEVEALKIVLLEWQNRPETRLTTGYADTELTSLRDALGSEYASTLRLIPDGPYGRSDTIFDSDDARKARILHQAHRIEPAMLAVTREAIQAASQQPDPKRSDFQVEWSRLLATDASWSLQQALVGVVGAVDTIVEELYRLPEWNGVDVAFHDQLEAEFVTTKLQSVAILFEIVLLLANSSTDRVTGEMMQEWLELLTRHGYFAQLQSDLPVQQSAIRQIQTSSSFATLALINPAYAMEFLESSAAQETPLQQPGVEWFLDMDRLEDLNRILVPAATSSNPCAGPVLLSWGLIFFKARLLADEARETRENRSVQKGIERATTSDSRRVSTSSAGSMNESVFEAISARIRPEQGIEDIPKFMLESAVRGSGVFAFLASMTACARESSPVLQSTKLQILQHLLAVARPALGYTPDIFNAQLGVLSPSYDDSTEPASFKPLLNFIAEPFLCDTFLDVAASRFPYEALPFLQITRLLAKGAFDSFFRDDGVHYITHRLMTMETFTQAATGGFESFHTTHESENANLVTLDETVDLLDHRSRRSQPLLAGKPGQQVSQIIPSGTVGEVISDSMPPVVRWHQQYSGLALLGRWLELHVKGELSTVISPFEPADDVAAATISLLGTLVSTTEARAVRKTTPEEAQSLCQLLIDEVSAGLEMEGDVVDCIFDIVEQQLAPTRRFSPASGSEVLAACVDFITILCKIQPSRIWPSLVKSSLFSAYGAKRTVYSVITSVEVPTQLYALLESCSALMQAVMDLVLAVSSRSSVIKGSKSRIMLAQRPLAASVLGLTETMYAAFEALPTWSFSQLRQKQNILKNLCSAFSNLLYYTFGTGSAFNVDHSITAAFRPAAEFLLNALSGTGIQSLGLGPIALNLVTATLGIESDIFILDSASHLKPLVMLARVHLGCSRLSGHALKEVNTTLVNLFPIFIRLPILHTPLLRPSLAIEYDIYDAFAKGQRPHLLGYLGSASCLAFLDSLKYLNAKAREEAHITWRLISRLVAPDQQWTAIVLITGSPPGKEKGNKQSTRGKPLIQQAVDRLVDVDNSHPTVTVALLKLLMEAQVGWPTVTDMITARQDLFPALIKYVNSRSAYGKSLDQAHHNQIVAGVTDLSVITLHALMASRNEAKFTPFIPLLTWLTQHAVDVAAYNSSLHTNLKKNFANKYLGLDVVVVRRTGILRQPYSDNYYYDRDFAGKLIGHDQYWDSGSQSFQGEFRLANINLSVVESELVLLRSFKYLCSEHGFFFARNSDVRVLMSRIITNCLRANMQVLAPEKLFDTLFQTRAEIAGMLLGPLVTIAPHGSEFTSILRIAYDSARYRNGSYQLALTNDDLAYWRSNLNNIRLALQFHIGKSIGTQSIGPGANISAVDKSISLLVDIASQIIGEGMATIISALQDQVQSRAEPSPDSLSADDVAMLLSLLQTILRLPSLPQFSSQLSTALIATSTTDSCLLLYSWSHTLVVENIPIYAPLAMQFLASLSQLPPVAEHLATSGIFSRLLSAKTTQKLQQLPQGAGHTDRRPNGGLYYNLFSDFLRISLNLLDSIGGGIASEVSVFLNAFSKQLIRASRSFAADDTKDEGSDGLTLGAATEVHNLSLISFILEQFRLAGASSAVDPAQILSLENFDEHRKAIAGDISDILAQDLVYRFRRIVPTNEVEAVWAKQKVGKQELDGQGKAKREKPRDSVLGQKILKALESAKLCLGGDGDEGA